MSNYSSPAPWSPHPSKGPGTPEPAIAAITKRIVENFDPLRIILFGSRARGNARPGSDIDILVVVPEAERTAARAAEIHQAVSGFQPPVDVIITTPDEIRRRGNLVGTVLRPALLEGRVVYQCRAGEAIREARAVSEDDARRAALEWLGYAAADLTAAELTLEHIADSAWIAGFHAQQAAEKSIKSIYIYLQIQYPFTHNLDLLRDALPDGWEVKTAHPDLRALSLWAVEQRYPGSQSEHGHEDAMRHVAQARSLIETVTRDLRAHGLDPDH
jgi:HEPN domain-containing protein/predicted nucleotidyltransferase